MWHIIDIVWPTCNDHFSEGAKEQVILDESLELSIPVRCDVHIVDGHVKRYLWSFEDCIVREHLQPASLCQVNT